MIHHLSCAELAAEVPAESVDWIITDPPYPKEFLPCWSELADFAAHALKPGGSLVAMSGNMFLPEVLRRLTAQDGLVYRWQICLDMVTGGTPGNWVWGIGLNQYWKPILWFYRDGVDKPPVMQVKTDYVRGISNQGGDKRFHKWGQEERCILNLCRKFAQAGDLIVDPFVGGGTTAIAALALGCEFIGADIDAEAVATTRRRMLEYQPVMPGCDWQSPQQNVTEPPDGVGPFRLFPQNAGQVGNVVDGGRGHSQFCPPGQIIPQPQGFVSPICC